MEIVKQNESYQISETRENGQHMIGTVSKDVNGVLSINFNLLTAGELSDEHIGDANYYMAEGTSHVSINFSVAESNRDDFMTYMDTVFDTVLNFFQTEDK